MKKTLIIFLFIPLLGGVRGGFSFAQSTAAIDSLLQVLQTATHDTTRIKTLNQLCLEYEFTDRDKAKAYVKQALELAKKTDYKKGIARSFLYLGYLEEDVGNYTQAISYYKKSLKISEQSENKKGIASSFGNIGLVYTWQGDYPKALEYHFKALKMGEELNDKSRIAICLGNIGIVYWRQGDYPKALEHYFKALKMDEELGDKSDIAADLSNIGLVYYDQGDYPKALEYYFKALKMAEELKYKQLQANTLGNIGNVYVEQGKAHPNPSQREGLFNRALEYYTKALKMDEELGNKNGIAVNLGNIGSLYTEQKKYPEAERYLLQALEVSTEIGALYWQKVHYKNLSELYKQTRQYQKAYEHYKEYSIAKDTMYNEEKSKEIGKLEAGFEYDKKLALEQAEHEKEAAVAASESVRQKVVIYAVSGGLLLLIVFFVLLFNRFRIIRRQKNIIEEQKQVVDEKNVEITQKNKDITDSIRYAENIQKAILPPIEEIKKALPDSFVLFKPKDIVSGDFYFYANVKTGQTARSGQTGTVVLAACDCTGHGVPGAFMSMIGNSLLNEIVNDKSITNAAEVLNQLRDGIIHTFGEAGATGEQKDGMDMALITISPPPTPPKGGESANLPTGQAGAQYNLQYAGAYNPLYLIRSTNKSPLEGGSPARAGQGGVDASGTKSLDTKYQPAGDSSLRSAALHSTQNDKFELTQIPADKQPVGYHFGEQKPFTNHEIQLQKGDTVYIFSDGYQDQFGGPRGKKFMSKRLRQLFLDIQEMNMEEQKEHLDKTIEDWKESREQVDDILVIGVRV